MGAYTGVFNHPFFAVTNDQGTFEIKNLPPGNYVIEAWHEKYGVADAERDDHRRRGQDASTSTSRASGHGESDNLCPRDAQNAILARRPGSPAGALLWLRERPRWRLRRRPRRPCRSGCTCPSRPRPTPHEIDGMFHLIMWITGIVFVIVEGVLLSTSSGSTAIGRAGRPHYTHGNNRLEVIWTIVPALICVMLALLSRRIWDAHQGEHARRTRCRSRSPASSSRGTSATRARTASSTRPTTCHAEPAPLPGRQARRRDARLEGRHPLLFPARSSASSRTRCRD